MRCNEFRINRDLQKKSVKDVHDVTHDDARHVASQEVDQSYRSHVNVQFENARPAVRRRSLLTISQQHCSKRVLPHLNMLRARDREPRNEDKNAVGYDQGHSRGDRDCSKDTRQMRGATSCRN